MKYLFLLFYITTTLTFASQKTFPDGGEVTELRVGKYEVSFYIQQTQTSQYGRCQIDDYIANHDYLHNALFAAYFGSQRIDSINYYYDDGIWIEAMTLKAKQ